MQGSDFQPPALDFLSSVGRGTDCATQLPVTSALGALAAWCQSATGDWETLLGAEEEGSALACHHSVSGFGWVDADYFSRSFGH